jgi:tRNA modification GTPase
MNTKAYFDDCICARATPPGYAAIAIVRCSGSGSHAILKKITNRNKKSITSSTCFHATVLDGKEALDDALIVPFHRGHGYTGEESFEIQCHGSEVIVAIILQLLQKHGARLAEPGEFSKRAFLNGRISLDKAEAVMDIVHAGTARAARIAVRQLLGGLDQSINSVKDECSGLLAEIEVLIDYPDDDIEVESKTWLEKIIRLQDQIVKLLEGFERGRLIREGVTAVLLGKTNAGKSTLFNYLVNEDKAIVSDIHGTTRDYLDGIINVGGIALRLYDTAGLRYSDDPLEMEGTRRAKNLSMGSDLVIFVIDSSAGYSDEDLSLLGELDATLPVQIAILIVHNKIDSLTGDNFSVPDPVIDIFTASKRRWKSCDMSAEQQTGIDSFNSCAGGLLQAGEEMETDDPLVTNSRHAGLLKQAVLSFDSARERLEEGIVDLAAFDVREVLNRLGEITGEVTADDVLNMIFEGFCVGK